MIAEGRLYPNREMGGPFKPFFGLRGVHLSPASALCREK